MSYDTMSEAIALSSPSGRMSKRARRAAERRLLAMLAAETPPPIVPTQRELDARKAQTLRRSAATLRELAARGMRVRSYPKRAAELEAQADNPTTNDSAHEQSGGA